MAIDGVFSTLLADEINGRLKNQSVSKIFISAKYDIIIHFSRSDKLVISANPSFPRVHLIKNTLENETNPTSFCMILRKYLQGAYLDGVETIGVDRVFVFHFVNVSNTMGLVKSDLVFELTGRNSNVLLVKDGMILDMLSKNINYPSDIYSPLKNDKLDYRTYSDDEYDLAKAIIFNLSEVPVSTMLTSVISGTSKMLVKSFLIKNSIEDVSIRILDEELIKGYLRDFCSYIKEKVSDIRPSVFYRDSKLCDMYFTSLEAYDESNSSFESLSDMLESYFDKKYRETSVNLRFSQYVKNLDTVIKREKTKLKKRQAELKDTDNSEKYLEYGNLLLANLYKIKKGDTSVDVENYYSQGETITITLDPKFSANQNSQNYFKKYRKLTNAKTILEGLIDETEDLIYYLEQQKISLEMSDDLNDANQVIDDLKANKIIKSQAKKGQERKLQKSSPRRYVTSSGSVILCGKNSKQNDTLTFKTARPDDLWFHVKDHHGSHVILQSKDPSDEDILIAATIAVMFSSAAKSRCQVDYTQIKNVKRIPGSSYGRVYYENFHSVIADAKDKNVDELDIKEEK